MRLWFGLIGLSALAGCFPYRGSVAEIETPMPIDVAGDPQQAERIYVLLPGRGDRVDRFRETGFIEAALASPAHEERVAWVATDAHFGYYRELDLPRRFEADILERWPRAKITVVGISMGGFGACVLARTFPERVDEVVLIAPYLGSPWFLRHRVKRGDLASRPKDSPKTRALLDNWHYLADTEWDDRISLLYGKRDLLALAVPLVRKRAPHVNIMPGPGGHKWKTWVPLWARYLEVE